MADDNQRSAGAAISLGFELAAGVGLGLLVGLWLERRYGWAPWASVIGSMVGLAGGLYLVIKQTLRFNKD